MEDSFDGLAAELQTHYRNMQDDLYDGLTPKVVEATNQALAWGQSPANILAHGLVAGMDAVGKDFGGRDPARAGSPARGQCHEGRDGDPAPTARRDRRAKVGTAVVGTVKGDIHDIGKNLVGMMWEGAGFEVINLGVNVDADKFLAAIHQHNATLLGMSALLTTTMPYMLKVIERLEEEGLRDASNCWSAARAQPGVRRGRPR